MPTFAAAAALIGRIFIAGIFLWDGWVMVRSYDASVAYAETFGVPGFLLPAAAALQLIGGALVVIGLWTREVAVLFALYCVATALIFHRNFADAGEILQFGKDFALAGGFLFLFANGAGVWSLDQTIRARR